MFESTVPNFGKGRILKKEMLENLRDFPRDFFDIYYKDCSDGIIAGAQAIVGDNCITVNRGIVKHNERIYIQKDDHVLPYYPTNNYVLIKIRFLNEVKEVDFNAFNAEIFLDSDMEVHENELELGRFKLRDGAVLRSDYTDFNDFITEFNTINIINVEYAGRHQSTINPLVLRYFSEIVLKSNSVNCFDISFAMLCLNQEVVERKLILYYISNRMGREYQDCSNQQIYKNLTFIAREIENGTKRRAEVRQSGPMKIIVD